MIKRTGVWLLVFILAACKQQKEHLPADQMERLLLDIQLAEVYGSMAGTDSLQTDRLRNVDSLAVFYQEVLDHHHVTFEQFKQSLDWYREHPDKLDTVYVRTMNTLDKDALSLQPAKTVPKDTLKAKDTVKRPAKDTVTRPVRDSLRRRDSVKKINHRK